jgi:hypothetical protein
MVRSLDERAELMSWESSHSPNSTTYSNQSPPVASDDIDAELAALSRAEYRKVAWVSAFRLLGPAVMIGLLIIVGFLTYRDFANIGNESRSKMREDPVRTMESMVRAVGKDMPNDELFAREFDFEDFSRSTPPIQIPPIGQ